MIAAADLNNKQQRLTHAYKAYGISVCSTLSQKLSDRLNDLGFTARVEDALWVEIDGLPQLPFKNIHSDADAVLVVTPTAIGFVATGLLGGYNNDYLPTISSVVSLLGTDRETPVYRGFHVTGQSLKNAGWQYTPPVTTFADFDALYANPKVSFTSLLDAADAIASSVVKDLGQQGMANLAQTQAGSPSDR